MFLKHYDQLMKMGYTHWILVGQRLGLYFYYATKHKYDEDTKFSQLEMAKEAAPRFETSKAPYFTMYEYPSLNRAIFGEETVDNTESLVKTFTYERIVIDEWV